MRRYDLAFHFIPYLVKLYFEGEIPGDYLKDKEIWVNKFGIKGEGYSITDIEIETMEVSSHLILFLYSLPEPQVVAEPKCAVLFIRTNTIDYAYYTLEKTGWPLYEPDPNKWIICQYQGFPPKRKYIRSHLKNTF